jgi:glucose 1-dehydrogenase
VALTIDLSNRVAMITGGGSGIGFGIGRRFAELGAKVALCDVEYEDAQVAAEELRESGGRAMAVELDVSDAVAVESVVDSIVKELGHVDVLVNAAGAGTMSPLLEMLEEEWDLVLDVNLKGTFLCTKFVARKMRERGEGGKIINLSSINEEIPLAGECNYCASKGGVRMFTRAAALELAPYGITVNAIGPGATETSSMEEVLQAPELRGEILRQIPLGRYGQPEDVAKVAVFLASELSDWVTGHTLYCDGGMHLLGEQSYLWVFERLMGHQVPDMPMCQPPGSVEGA